MASGRTWRPEAAHPIPRAFPRQRHDARVAFAAQPIVVWVDVFGNRETATAILDRLLHHAGSLSVYGNSCRVKVKLKAGLVRADRAEA